MESAPVVARSIGDEAIQDDMERCRPWIASLRSQ